MKVCKFGGSSVAEAAQIRKVKSIVEQDSSRRIIVVSAPGKRHKQDEKITDLLYACHAKVEKGESIDALFGTIRSRFLEIAQELKVSGSLEDSIAEVKETIKAGASADYAASRGEYLSGLLIAEFLGAEFVDAEKVVRLTDDGRVHEKSYQLVAQHMAERGLYVLPGFYGATLDGTLKTFSRGGSDISGAIAARGVHAEVYENWTDVSGILMADPRVVDNPKPIEEITYREIREMASVGANVFHEEAIAPVKSMGIPINVKNTNAPVDKGTFIVAERDIAKAAVVGVSGKKPYRKVLIEKFMLNRHPEFPYQVQQALRKTGLALDFELKGFDTLALFVGSEGDIDWNELQHTVVQNLNADSCKVDEEVAIIGVVGEGLAAHGQVVGMVLKTLKQSSIAVEALNYGGSPVTLLVGVPIAAYTRALQALAKGVEAL
jgi:aspartate kinase